jgi:hypothetical protein
VSAARDSTDRSFDGFLISFALESSAAFSRSHSLSHPLLLLRTLSQHA